MPLFAVGALEARASGELRGLQAAGVVDLRYAEGEIPVIAPDEIPSICLELVFDRVDNACGAKDAKDFFPTKQASQQLVETGEVVHMEMRDEDVADTQELARSQSIEIANIEQQRAPLEHKVHVKAGIVEGIVDERGIEMARHESFALLSAFERSRRRFA